MTEHVLTDEEKSALLDGVQSGAVEVHTAAGQRYADVRLYEFPAGARIRSNSYPHLQVLNQQLAERLAKLIDKTLHCEMRVIAGEVASGPFGKHCRTHASPPAVIPFAAPPLEGQALLVIDSVMIGRLVECFYGGNNESASSIVAFTAAEISVCRLFGNAVLASIGEVWNSLVALKPTMSPPILGIEFLESIEDRETVICTRFDARFADGEGAFSVIWPHDMVANLLPVFEGQKRERNAAADVHWQKSLRGRLPEALVTLDVTVGHVQKQLGDLTGLKPGDVIDIDNPQLAEVLAGKLALLNGRFGVLAGRNAIEMTGWTAPQSSH